MSEKQSDVPTATILVVDDNPDNLHLLIAILSRQGYKVRPAPNGTFALKSAQSILPDLILLDIRLPDMDGYRVCEQLKADERTRDIPVIFISALQDVTDKVKGFTLGGVDFITKPFQVEEVLARVTTHLTLRNLQSQLREANGALEKQVHELACANAKLQEALDTIKTLSGLIPICSWCGRRIRDEGDHWVRLESYIEAHTKAIFSHGICPDCKDKLF